MSIVRIPNAIVVRKVDAEARTVDAVISDKSLDRYGTIIQPRAFEKYLDRFMANPVMLAGHLHVGPAGQPTVIGSWRDMRISDDSMVAQGVFAEKFELADQYLNLYHQKHMRAFSIGFIPHKASMVEVENDGGKRKVKQYEEGELIEASAVAVPANVNALARGLEDIEAVRDEMEKMMRELIGKALNETLSHKIQSSVEEALLKSISTEPGSPLQLAIMDAVTAVRLGSHVDDPIRIRSETDEALLELKAKFAGL